MEKIFGSNLDWINAGLIFLIIISLIAMGNLIVNGDSQGNFCRENNMIFIYGDREAFDYCVDENGNAYKIGTVNGKIVFIEVK